MPCFSNTCSPYVQILRVSRHDPNEAWRVHDGLFTDERVGFYPEPAGVETRFREYASGQAAAPKLWADAWLLAVARSAEGLLVTFDRALAARSAECLLLGEPL